MKVTLFGVLCRVMQKAQVELLQLKNDVDLILTEQDVLTDSLHEVCCH